VKFFANIRQPLAGIWAVIVYSALTAVIVLAFTFVYGAVDPTFNTAQGGTGWVATAMIVLFGFYGYGVLSNSPGHWPWKDLGIKQPVVGIIEVLLRSVITTILFMLLMYPNLSAWTQHGKPRMSLPAAVGWFYSVIVSWLTTALLWENWPWSKIRSRAWSAVFAFLGNFIGGTAIYYIFLSLLKSALIPAEAQDALKEGINLWPAQLGVVIVGLILVWGLAFQNVPRTSNMTAKIIIRTIIVYGSGILLFIGYTRWFGPAILHEPAVTGHFGGDPLNFVDLFNLILLIYIVYFHSWPLKLKQE
jgi:AAT family amino acid transporter